MNATKNSIPTLEVGQPSEERWLKSPEACQYLNISGATLHRWVKAKRIVPKRTPTGEYRFRLSQLDAVLA